MNVEKIKIFLVDDDALFLKSLEIEFQQHSDFTIETFATGELCMKNLSHNPDVIILDYFLDSVDKNALNGMEILAIIKKINCELPVVILSGMADKIKMASELIDDDSYVFVVKSKTAFSSLQKILSSIFRHKKDGKEIALVFGVDPIPFQLSVSNC